MDHTSDRARPGPDPSPRATLGFVVGAAATTLAGVLIQVGVVPTTDLSEDYWRYPWESTSAYVILSAVYAALHVLIIGGLVAFERRGITGPSPAAHRGVRLAIGGTVLLTIGELASIPLHDALVDDSEAVAVGGLFGLAMVCSALGFLLCGWTTIRAGVWTGWRRFAPLATGIWITVMVPLTALEPTLLPGSVGVYGLCLLAVAAAMTVDPASRTASADDLALQGV